MRIAERTRNTTWSRERIEALGTPELRQLHANALRLNEPHIAAVCDALRGARPRGRPPVRKPKVKGAKLASVKSEE
jgi:hypothetical protein